MKKIPFYPNHSSGMYCILAVYRSLFDYFFNEKLSWEEIEEKGRAERGKAAWTMLYDTELAKRGVDVINIEPLDYKKLFEGKEDYLRKIYDKQTADYYITQSNILNVLDTIPDYLKSVSHIGKNPTVEDIEDLLQKGYAVGAEVNSRILNNKPGFSLHYILIQKGEENSFIIHDPGLPPIENRRITREQLEKSLANGINAFKKK